MVVVWAVDASLAVPAAGGTAQCPAASAAFTLPAPHDANTPVASTAVAASPSPTAADAATAVATAACATALAAAAQCPTGLAWGPSTDPSTATLASSAPLATSFSAAALATATAALSLAAITSTLARLSTASITVALPTTSAAEPSAGVNPSAVDANTPPGSGS